MGMKFRFEPDPYRHRLTNRNDVELRYHESMVMYKGEPVQVHSVGGSTDWDKVMLIPFQSNFKMDSNKAITVSIIHEKDISTDFNFGWMNYSISDIGLPNAVYLERLPTRRYKQGATTQNVMSCHPSISNENGLMWQNTGPNIAMLAQCLSSVPCSSLLTANMKPSELIEYTINKMLTLNDANYKITFNRVSIALSKRVALIWKPVLKLKSIKDINFIVMIDKQEIGTYTPNIMDVELNKPGLYSIVHDELVKAGLTA